MKKLTKAQLEQEVARLSTLVDQLLTDAQSKSQPPAFSLDKLKKPADKPATDVEAVVKPIDAATLSKFMNIFVSNIRSVDPELSAKLDFNTMIKCSKAAGYNGLAKDLISESLRKGYMRYDKRHGKPYYGLSVKGKEIVNANITK